MFKVHIGDRAIDFSLFDQNNKKHTLSYYRGKWVLLYFYPKDDTPGCTKEACTIRDAWSEFEKFDALVFGISTDTVESHKKFAYKHSLPFTLLADPEKHVVTEYGVYGKRKFLGKEYMGTTRSSLLIDPEGHIARTYDKVRPGKHAEEVLSDIAELKQ